MKVILGIFGAAFLLMGLYQGLNLGGIVGEYPPRISGILGGGFPVVAGVLGTLLLTFAFRPDSQAHYDEEPDSAVVKS